MNANLEIINFLRELFVDNSLILAVLSNPKGEIHPQKITIKPVKIKQNIVFQATLLFKDRAIHKNYSALECYDFFLNHILNDFKQASIFTETSDVQLLVGKKGNITKLIKPPSKVKASVEHNRKKNYLLEEGSVIPFLVELGISSPTGKIFDKKRDKFRQINRFLEVFDDLFIQLNSRKIWHIVDFGCGKAYLTFALYHYLTYAKGLEVEMVGLDLKKDVIEFCQALAIKLGYFNLKFKLGDINEHVPDHKVDVMLSLHACDTATDAALEQAVRWNAEAILSVPCCQHELYSQLSNPQLEPLLKHGIIRERMAALATDAARGQILEILGYRTQILEFVDLENTPKNLMIRAVREKNPTSNKVLLERYLDYKNALNITPSLEKRFKKELGLA